MEEPMTTPRGTADAESLGVRAAHDGRRARRGPAVSSSRGQLGAARGLTPRTRLNAVLSANGLP